jgi:hypothetical protein
MSQLLHESKLLIEVGIDHQQRWGVQSIVVEAILEPHRQDRCSIDRGTARRRAKTRSRMRVAQDMRRRVACAYNRSGSLREPMNLMDETIFPRRLTSQTTKGVKG